MTERTHRHTAADTDERPFDGPITSARQPNTAAHGNITETDKCRCGAERRRNVNGRHVETGQWYTR